MMHSELVDSSLDHIVGSLRQPAIDCGAIAYEPLGTRRQRQGRDRGTLRPLVSIITVTYNAEETVEHAIRSVADQTYSEIEYLIIDGGSTDRTLEIVRRNAAHVDCLISEPDRGIYDAMNKGLARARGKYIVLLNGDDRLFSEFIYDSVRMLEQTQADISYCDYMTEDGPVHVGELNEGIFLSQLGIKHNTFMMKRECFLTLGGFDPNLKVVSDAKWNRAAYAAGLKFKKVPGIKVFYSLRGLSAGASAGSRDEIIAESADLITRAFPGLDRAQATTLYLSNFNTHKSAEILALRDKFATSSPTLSRAIESAMLWNLAHRPGYRLRANDPNSISQILTLARGLSYPLENLIYDDPGSAASLAMSRFISTLSEACRRRDATGKKICLHFARKFSSPSETFIYDFVKDLDAEYGGLLNVFLCDERLEEKNRPHDLTLTVGWNALDPKIRTLLYDLLWETLAPDMVVAHFALNGWFLHDRLRPEQRQATKWINMCHGIDVFAYGDDPNYTAYIDQYCAYAPNVAFTTVSAFLGRLLSECGVPEDKIFTVPNAVGKHFGKVRKRGGFWNTTRTEDIRPVKLLSVGRLIDWKGHDILIRALSELHERRPDLRINLEIVYGRWDENLRSLEALRDSLALPGDVRFIDFVDFRAQPGYFAEHDLFVLPSTTSDHPVPRTETFGVAMIEAIASGLPVIGTDTGGLPEVIGTPNPQARIVPHGEVAPLSEALEAMIDDAERVFVDNSAYSDNRMNAFSAEQRLEKWRRVRDWLGQRRKKIFHFCALTNGGAAGASLNIHKGFLLRGYDSWFVTRDIDSNKHDKYAANVIRISPENSVDFNHIEPPRRTEFTTFSLDDHIISNSSLEKLVEGADLINLTWPAKFLSVQNIALLTRMGVPVLMTLRDMNMITGGCHFFHGCSQWETGCHGCPQRPDIATEDYPAAVFKAKMASWNVDAITFVALSDHSRDILSRSPLANRCPIVKLPNYVDSSAFHRDDTPYPPASRIPAGTLKIGYLPSFGSRVKGHREFIAALERLYHKRPDLKVTIQLAANDDLDLKHTPYEVIKIGAISNRNILRQFYNAADIIAVPSLEETFSNTVIEALACGTPVVGFRTGILPEVLTDGLCGAAVEVGDIDGLADSIAILADTSPDRNKIAATIAENFNRDSRIEAYINTIEALPPVARVETSGPEALGALLRVTSLQHRLKSDAILGRLRHMRDNLRSVQRSLSDERRRHPEIQAEMEAVRKSVDKQRGEIENLRHVIGEKDHEMEATRHVIGEKDRELEATRQVIGEKDRELEATRQVIGEKDHGIEAIINSTSWKVTAPLRSLGRGLRKITFR